MDKQTIRQRISAQKRALTASDIEAAGRRLSARLFAAAAYRRAPSVYVYLSFNQEVPTRPIVERAWADGKRVAAPRVDGDAMTFRWLSGFDGLVESRYGAMEPPEGAPAADDDAALVIVPGLVFDARGHRIGYGGGYYDRWLAAHPGHPTAALCYGFQLVEALPIAAHDIPVDEVIADDATRDHLKFVKP